MGRGSLLQHYFDSRGVVRLYEMTFGDGLWHLERTSADFSALDFSQRYHRRLNEDASRIDGAWEIAEDHQTWVKDFDLSYVRTK